MAITVGTTICDLKAVGIYRWRKEYGGLKLEQAKRLKDLEKEKTERHACRLLEQGRGTQRYKPIQRNDEDALTRNIIELVSKYGRYGYRRITVLLQSAGWRVGKDRVQCIWRREGLKVPANQKPRGRLWLHDGSCIRLRPSWDSRFWSPITEFFLAVQNRRWTSDCWVHPGPPITIATRLATWQWCR